MKTPMHARLTMMVLMVALMSWSVTAADRDPISAARFAITVDGYEIASFTRFESLVDPSGGDTARMMSLSGGQSQGIEMAAWHEAVLLGDIVAARKSCSIVMYNEKGTPIKTYHLQRAWPAKYTGVSTSRALRPEAVVIVYEGLTID